MQVKPLESLTKEELIELIKQEREETSDLVLNTKYTDGYISGYVVACNLAASLASEAWVNHVFHTGLDGLIERCKNMEQVLLEKAQACQDSGSRLRTFLPVEINPEIEDINPLAMTPEGWKLVPVEPTDEMKKAGCQVPLNKAARHNACYKAMLAAAPKFGEE